MNRRAKVCFSIVALLVVGSLAGAFGATGKVIKVLPHYLDLQGRHLLTPSLYDRDAYQLYLRQHPLERSSMRFDVQWKIWGGVYHDLRLRLELVGTAQGNVPAVLTLEKTVEHTSRFSQWTAVSLSPQQYHDLGEVTAWKISLLEGERLLGTQQSFLWTDTPVQTGTFKNP